MTDTSSTSIQFAAATDIGCRRENNEDSFGYDTESHLYVVCDGMGGSAAGEVASGLAVRYGYRDLRLCGINQRGNRKGCIN